MKKLFYVSLFTFLGILVSFLLHAGLEIAAIHFLLKDFTHYGMGFTWEEWIMVHNVGSIVLLLGGALIGFLEGKRWWRVIYIERVLGIKY